jgi:hypothetical protein
MKSTVYVGAVLMTAACIYGFVDYRKTSNSKEFKSLYRTEAASTTSALSLEQLRDVNAIGKVNEKIKIEEPATVFGDLDKTEPVNGMKEVKSLNSKRTSSKRKKLNYKLYSRAALERFTPPVIVEDVEKTEKK